jgi:hypothetical protein
LSLSWIIRKTFAGKTVFHTLMSMRPVDKPVDKRGKNCV